MNKVLVLASGGLDSSVLIALYRKLNYDIEIMYASYGQKNYREEVDALTGITEQFCIPESKIHEIVVNVPWSNSSTTGGAGGAYVEMRNLIFLSYAISYCEAHGIDLISLGYIKTADDYNDTSDTFIEDIRILANRSSGIRIDVPLKDMTKYSVYKFGKQLGLNPAHTFSCNTPVNGKPCGKCGDCKDWEIINRMEGKLKNENGI